MGENAAVRLTSVLLTAMCLLLIACSGSTTAESSTPGGPNCSPDAVGAIVDSFVTAYNGGQTGLTDRFFAEPDRFQWYSENHYRNNDEARDRSTLEAYLARRHSEGHRLELTHFAFGAYRDVDRTGHFTFVAADAATPVGKGAIDCDTGRIMVWSF
jgi:hypothetical protein